MKFLKHKRRESHISITNELTKLPKEPLNSLYDNKTYTKLTSFEHTKTKSSKHRSSTIETSKQNSQSNERRPSSTTSESNNRSEHFADSNQRKSLLDPSTTTSGLGPPISLSQTPSYALVIHQLQKVKVSSILKLFCWMKYNYWKMIKPQKETNF